MTPKDRKKIKQKPADKRPLGPNDYLFLSRYTIDSNGKIVPRKDS